MARQDDKWVMFRNYMHNELGITKEDIRQWITDAVNEQVKQLVANSFNSWSLKSMAEEQIKQTLKEDYKLRELLYNQILNKIKFQE